MTATPSAKARILILALVILAVAGRVDFEASHVDFNQDKARQLFIAQCFSEGHGLGFSVADPTDLSRSVTERVDHWPIGYPLLVAALQQVVGDYLLASIVLDSVGILLLLWALCGMLRLLVPAVSALSLFLIFTAFAFTPYLALGSTDLLSGVLFVCSLYLALDYLVADRARPGRCVLIGLFVFLSAFLRYAYYPLLAVIPFCLLVAGLLRREKRFVTAGFVVGFSALLPLLCVLAFHWYYFGVLLPLRGGEETYPANLLHIDAFPLESLLPTDLLAKNLHIVMPALEPLVRPVALLLSLLILCVVLAPAVSFLLRRSAWRSLDGLAFYHLLAAFSIVANAGLMCHFSYTNPPQTNWTAFFTHVQETRYYAISMFLIQVSLVVILFRRAPRPRIVRVAVGSLLSLALLFSVGYGLHRMREVHLLGEPTAFDRRELRVGEVASVITDRTEGRLEDVVYVDVLSQHNACLMALTLPVRIILHYDRLLAGPAVASGRVVLFMRTSVRPMAAVTAFIEQHSGVRVAARPEWDLYRIDF